MKRKFEESQEAVKATINKNVPEAKFQADQQVVDSSTVKSQTGSASFLPEKKEARGSQLKQELVSDLVSRTSAGGGNAGDGSTFAGRSVSGDGANVLAAANQTPVGGQARSASRIGKKLDRNTTKLNFIPNDQYMTDVQESKPLAAADGDDQGYNGTYRNEFARLQKTSGAVPGDLLFDRALNQISRDELYFGQGQQVYVPFTDYDDALAVTVEGIDDRGLPIVGPYETRQNGNFLTTSVDIKIDPNGQLEYMGFEEYDITPEVDPMLANKSSVARTCLMNDAEVVREILDSKAGDEKADIWTPLARAVQRPTQTVGFLRDMEAETGNEIFAAYKKSSLGFAYQLNRAHCDGQDTVSPAMQYMLGLRRNDVSQDYADQELTRNIANAFNVDHYVNGSASTMIALYDSVQKYTSKADLLVQPRGFRMHLQTADNNMDSFHMDALFAQAFTGRECFSTIDRSFDGTLPVMMTDKAGIIHKISWSDIGTFVRWRRALGTTHGKQDNNVVEILPSSVTRGLTGVVLNVYFNETAGVGGDITFEEGVLSGNSFLPNDRGWMIELSYEQATEPVAGYNAVRSYELGALGLSVDTEYLSVPAPDNRNEIIRPIHCGPATYSYSDLRNNYSVTMNHPLLAGIDRYITESIGGKWRNLCGNRNINIATIHSTKYASLWSFILCAATPYIQKERINTMRDVLYYEKNVSYPFDTMLTKLSDASTKNSPNYSFVDYDHEIVVGTMPDYLAVTWTMPELFQRIITSNDNNALMCPWYSCEEDAAYGEAGENDSAAMCYPSIRTGVRFKPLDDLYGLSEKDVRLSLDMVSTFAPLSESVNEHGAYKYGATTDGQLIITHPISEVMSAIDVMSLPRNIGRYMVAPYGVLTPTYEGEYSTRTLEDLAGTSSYIATYWTGLNPSTYVAGEGQVINNPVSMNVGRAENFVAHWYSVLASGTTPPTDHGFVLSLNALGDDVLGAGAFRPFTMVDGAETIFRSTQKAMWTRVQKIPFAISPFDGVSGTPDVIYDPYDMLYWFGLCGFRASDYRESVYNREKEIINQGMLFVQDPWVTSSPLFKAGATSSGAYSSNSFKQ